MSDVQVQKVKIPTYGNKQQVWNSECKKTKGNLTKENLMEGKGGKIISIKAYEKGKKLVATLRGQSNPVAEPVAEPVVEPIVIGKPITPEPVVPKATKTTKRTDEIKRLIKAVL